MVAADRTRERTGDKVRELGGHQYCRVLQIFGFYSEEDGAFSAGECVTLTSITLATELTAGDKSGTGRPSRSLLQYSMQEITVAWTWVVARNSSQRMNLT